MLEGTGPTGRAVLTRQNVPVLEGTDAAGVPPAAATYSPRPHRRRCPTCILIATGCEVQFALAARSSRRPPGISTRVVSMPCVEWFNEQDQPTATRSSRRSAGSGGHRGRHRAGLAPLCRRSRRGVSLEHFGASADYQTLYEEFGFTAEHVVAAARTSLARARKETVS